MQRNLLLGAAAVGVLITGAIAQTSSSIERIKDPAGQQGAARETEPRKNVRTVYPNTQNAEQAARESKTAQGTADASRQAPGDVAPVSGARQPSSQPPSKPKAPPNQAATPAAPAPTSQQNAQTPSAPPPSTQPPPAATAAQPAAPPQPAAAPPSRAGSSSVIALDAQQQTSVGRTIAQRGFRPLTNVSFSIAVGTKVPTSVQLHALPSDFVTFVPQYRGYSFVVVEEQIVIVDPGTHEIVAIVPYTVAAPATRTVETDTPRTPVAEKPMANRPVNLNTGDKAVSRRPVAEQRKRPARSVVKREVREERPSRTMTIEEGPVRGPAFRSHRYIDDDDEVIVAPRQNGFFGLFR